MTVVLITKDDYLELLRWDDDGGQNWDVVYQIVPDQTSITPTVVAAKSSDNGNPGKSYAESPADLETIGA